jgi:hypothetical protein
MGGGDMLALCSSAPLLAFRLLDAFERNQISAALLG